MHSLEILIKVLESSNHEFRIKDAKGNIAYCSPLFNEMVTNLVKYDESIFQYQETFFEISIKSILLDENYTIEELVDVSKYIQKIEEQKEDKITTLPNRNKIEDYLVLNYKSETPFIIVLCDIDDFKVVNDNYGHPVGDLVLNELGAIFKENMRECDFVGRYGGEEFLMVFKTEKLKIVIERLNRIREEIKRRINYRIINQELSFSAGIAIYQQRDEIAEVLKNADQALYYVKNHGKNNNAIYEFIKHDRSFTK